MQKVEVSLHREDRIADRMGHRISAALPLETRVEAIFLLQLPGGLGGTLAEAGGVAVEVLGVFPALDRFGATVAGKIVPDEHGPAANLGLEAVAMPGRETESEGGAESRGGRSQAASQLAQMLVFYRHLVALAGDRGPQKEHRHLELLRPVQETVTLGDEAQTLAKFGQIGRPSLEGEIVSQAADRDQEDLVAAGLPRFHRRQGELLGRFEPGDVLKTFAQQQLEAKIVVVDRRQLGPVELGFAVAEQHAVVPLGLRLEGVEGGIEFFCQLFSRKVLNLLVPKENLSSQSFLSP